MQGVLFASGDNIKTPMDVIRLWLHEASRVYGDKLIDEKDMEHFKKIKYEITKAGFEVSRSARVYMYRCDLIVSVLTTLEPDARCLN